MANQPFYPGREGDQLLWLNNLNSKIAAYFTALDISTARQTKIQLALTWFIWAWQIYLPARRQDAPAATAWRNQLATGTSDASTNTEPPTPAALTPPALRAGGAVGFPSNLSSPSAVPFGKEEP
jgi:hypothetical protein